MSGIGLFFLFFVTIVARWSGVSSTIQCMMSDNGGQLPRVGWLDLRLSDSLGLLFIHEIIN